MRIAYLVFGYKNPSLLARQVSTLHEAEHNFFVHIDRKHRIEPFIKRLRGRHIHFLEPRLPVYWAEFSGVEATLALMRHAIAASTVFDYCVLLSGSEYPLQSGRYIANYLRANAPGEFISMTRVPAPGKPLERIETYRPQSSRPMARFLAKAKAKVGWAQRDHREYFGELTPYSGITWWALSRQACEYVLTFTDRNPRFVEFFRDMFAPEESYIHTILGNSELASNVRRNLVYEDWSREGAHPEAIDERHLAFFESQYAVSVESVYGPGELLFARKFSDENLQLVDRVDRMIESKESCRCGPIRMTP
jgi:hypothetical protein